MNVALVVVVGTSNDTELGAMRQEHTYLTFFKTLVKKITSIFVKKIAFSSCRERFRWCLLFQARKASPIYNFAFTLFSSFQFICSLFFQIIWIVLLARAIIKWSGLRYYNIHSQIKKAWIYLLKKAFVLTTILNILLCQMLLVLERLFSFSKQFAARNPCINVCGGQ